MRLQDTADAVTEARSAGNSPCSWVRGLPSRHHHAGDWVSACEFGGTHIQPTGGLGFLSEAFGSLGLIMDYLKYSSVVVKHTTGHLHPGAATTTVHPQKSSFVRQIVYLSHARSVAPGAPVCLLSPASGSSRDLLEVASQ